MGFAAERRATFKVVEYIGKELHQCEQVQIKEKYKQQFYHEVMGFID